MTDTLQLALDSLADGTPVDWAALEAQTPEALRPTLQRLREISSIADAHAVAPPGPPQSVPFEWGFLHVEEYLARGAHGDVYRAWDPRLERHVALKLLRDDPADDRSSQAISEGRLLARVRHPNVVTVHGADRVDGQAGLWMELIEGQTLREIVEEQGPLPVPEAVAIARAICDGLAAIHDAGLIHRDVKAQNVIRAATGRITLMDLGGGRDDARPDDTFEGTPLYLAPEVLRGAQATAASDIYAVGVLLFFLVTGRYPVAGRSLDDLRQAHDAGRRERLGAVRSVPPSFSDVVDRALSADPTDRFGSVSGMRATLDAPPRLGSSRLRLPALAAATLGLGLVIWAGWARPMGSARTAFHSRDWILLTSIVNQTGNRQFDGALDYALERELNNSSYVNVVSRERLEDALRLMARPADTAIDSRTGREAAIRDGNIRFVVEGSLEGSEGGYALEVQIVNPHDGAVVGATREEAAGAAGVTTAVRRTSNWVRVTLGELPVQIRQGAEQLEKVQTPSSRALRLYTEAVRVFRRRDWGQAEALLGSALAEDPGFAFAHLRLAWTLHNLDRPVEQVVASAQRAVDLVGTVPERERYAILGGYYRFTDQYEMAIGQFEALAGRYPDDAEGLNNLVSLYSMTSQQPKATALLVRIADGRPNDVFARIGAAQSVLGSSGVRPARVHIDRAKVLMATAPEPSNARSALAKSWFLLFPVHEFWTHEQARDAASALDGVAVRLDVDGQDPLALNMIVKLRLALGQLKLAEQVNAHVPPSGMRTLNLSELALARNDLERVDALWRSYRGGDVLLAASHLVRAGYLDAAERILEKVPNDPAFHFAWAREEIAEARGDRAQIVLALQAGAPWTRVMTGARAFLYSETLARAAADMGDIAGAIRVLEESAALGERLFAANTHSGYYWMRVEILLADLYRQTRQLDKARTIERTLLATLAAADDDFPLLLELRKRTGA